MLTILAWIVFVPAIVLSFAFFLLVLSDFLSSKPGTAWVNKRNLRDLALSLLILFVPSVYLFGWF